MKKILFSCLLFLIATVTNAQIYLGSGTTQTGIAPIDVNYGYSYTQQIFTKTEIGATSAGNITAVKFFLPAAADISNSVAWKVYVGHTTLSIFSGTTAWIPVASLTEVFTGNVANVGGEVTITFNAPFAYNNTDNLVVAVLEDTPDYTASSNRFYTYSGVTNSTLYYRSDTTVPNPASPPTGTRSPTKSRIGIMGLIPLPPACPSLTAPSAGSTTVSATPSFTWSAASGAAGYKISLGTAPGGTDIMNAVDVGNVTTYQYITGLMYGTQYYLTVSAYNVSGDSTGCTERTFTVTTTVPCPTVTAPFTSQTGVSVTPTFTWSAVPYATDYIISIGTTSGGTDILNAQSVGNVTSYTYSGTPALAPNTQYYYNIRAASGTYLSGTCSNRNFTTQCPTVSAPFMQDFSSGVLPACWSNQNPDSTSTTAMWKFTGNAGTGASQANNGRAGGTYAWVDASSPYDDMHNVELLTPLIDLTGLTAPLVSFEWFKNHSTSTTVPSPSTYDDNKLTVDINDGNGWVTFFTSSSNDPLWRTVNIPLPASYIGATIQVRFTVDKNTGTNPYFYDDLLLDNVEVKEVPACMMPAGPYSVSGVTMSSAVVNWTAPVILPTGYTVYYSATNTAPDATTVLDATNSVSVLVPAVSTVISGLTHATPYYVWVRSNCGTTSSDWLSVGTFTTLCNAFTVPYFENFDTTTVGTSTNNNAPNCWKYLEPSGWAGYGYVSTNNFSPPNGYYIYDSGTSGGGMLVSPTTTALMNGNNRVRFMANAGGNNYNLQVGTLSDPSDPATFTAIGALIPLTTTFAQYTVDIPAGTDQYLVFRHPGQTVSGTSIRLDDIYVEEIPSCLVPSGALSTGSTLNSVSLSWTASPSAPANGYEVYYSTVNTAPDATTVLDAANSVTSATVSATIGSLTADTVYYIWVRAKCAAADASSWIGPVVASTGYCPVSTTNQGSWFTSFTSTGAITNLNYTSPTAAPGTNGYQNLSASQTLANYAGSSTTIAFTIGGSSTSGVAVWIDWNDDLLLDASERVYNTTSYTLSNSGTITVPAGTAVGNYRMRMVVHNSSNNPSNPCLVFTRGEYIDMTFEVTATPTCFAPTGMTVGTVTTSTADLTWTAATPVPGIGYEVYYNTSNTAPTASTVLDGTNSVFSATTSAQLTGLTASSTYYVWIRSNCNASDVSAWLYGGSFATTCTAASIPYVLDFETVTPPALPGCTSNVNVGTGNNWVSGAIPTDSPGFDSKVLMYSWHANAANTWFFTQGMNMTAGTTYYISYKYGNNSTSFTERLKVAMGTSPTVAAMETANGGTLIADYPSIKDKQAHSVVDIAFTPATTGVYYLGFNAYSVADQFRLYLDDISVSASQLNTTDIKVTTSEVKVYPNPFTDVINISDVKDLKSVSVIDASGRMVKTIATPGTQIYLGELKSGLYILKLDYRNGSVKTVKVVKK